MPVPLLHLHPDDPVAVLTASARQGDRLTLGDRTFPLDRDLGLGHKIAIRPIAAGQPVLKYGYPIGTATCAIAPGDHVHLHNLRSDVIPTSHRTGTPHV